MGTALLVLAAVLFIAAVVIFVTAPRRPKEPRGARQDPLRFNAAPEFGPRQLGPAAIVSYGGIDYVVRGSVTYREDPFVWWEHRWKAASSRSGSASKMTTDGSSWRCGSAARSCN